MTKQTQPADPDPRTNLLLKMLDSADCESLMAKGKVVNLKLGARLFSQDDPVDAVYFPLTCMVCLLVSTSNKKSRLELATVSNEGVIGATEALHCHGALGVQIIQIPGAAVRIPANTFVSEMASLPGAERLFNRYLYVLTRQILRGALCNHLHSMEERCARWLLVTHDTAGQDIFPITQEFLSHMLGVRRATVNEAVGALKKANLISYVRGKLTVKDREGLEAASCECYGAVKQIYVSAMAHRPKVRDDSSSSDCVR